MREKQYLQKKKKKPSEGRVEGFKTGSSVLIMKWVMEPDPMWQSRREVAEWQDHRAAGILPEVTRVRRQEQS